MFNLILFRFWGYILDTPYSPCYTCPQRDSNEHLSLFLRGASIYQRDNNERQNSCTVWAALLLLGLRHYRRGSPRHPARRQQSRKGLGVTRILEYARWEDIWRYLTVDDVRENFERLSFRWPRDRELWAYALKRWSRHG